MCILYHHTTTKKTHLPTWGAALEKAQGTKMREITKTTYWKTIGYSRQGRWRQSDLDLAPTFVSSLAGVHPPTLVPMPILKMKPKLPQAPYSIAFHSSNYCQARFRTPMCASSTPRRSKCRPREVPPRLTNIGRPGRHDAAHLRSRCACASLCTD